MGGVLNIKGNKKNETDKTNPLNGNSCYIAITGGIGSGKSVICQRLKRRGIEVYDCDDAAKRLMRGSVELQNKLQELVGEGVYVDGLLQKNVLAQYILASNENKQAVNDIVHPIVADDFLHSGFHWLESAILFDSGFDTRIPFRHIICVTAPLELRIQRVMERDGISEDKAKQWIQRQLPQEEMLSRSNWNLVSGRDDIEEQIDKLLIKLQK